MFAILKKMYNFAAVLADKKINCRHKQSNNIKI
jgi:hypothetical protein